VDQARAAGQTESGQIRRSLQSQAQPAFGKTNPRRGRNAHAVAPVKTYFDTSYLVALYVPNDHTAAALRHRERSGPEPILFTPLHRLELRTTVRQCAHSRLIGQEDTRQILRHIEEDLDDGTLLHEPIEWTKSLRQAELVAERRGWTMTCRSLDLWHLAVALASEMVAFVTFDQDQLALALAEGLQALTPP